MYRLKVNLVQSTLALLALLVSVQASNCKCFPGDKCWPTPTEWTAFNKTLGGKLVATVPLAAPCHDDKWASYSEATCEALQANWTNPELQ